MKKIRSIVCILLALAICCSFSACGGSNKYRVQCTDGSVQQLTSSKIIELYNQEPTRDNPTNVMKDAIISGTGTVTSFSCTSDTSTKNYLGQYYLDQYSICVNDSIYISFRTPKDDGIKLQLYVGDKINFIGKLSSESSTISSVSLYPNDGYHLRAGNSTGITLVE